MSLQSDDRPSPTPTDTATPEGSAPGALPWILPFGVLLALTSVGGFEALRPWYPWVYAATVAGTLAAWWLSRRHYPRPLARGVVLGALAGIAGTAVWVALAHLRLEGPLLDRLPDWLVSKERVGLDPFAAIDSPVGCWMFIATRFVGLTVAVPLAEEVFWRGFLLRWVASSDFRSVPIGRITPLGFAIVTVGFVLVHPEIIAAIVWCAAANLLLGLTRNLWACIAFHASSNLALGVWVVAKGDWQLW